MQNNCLKKTRKELEKVHISHRYQTHNSAKQHFLASFHTEFPSCTNRARVCVERRSAPPRCAAQGGWGSRAWLKDTRTGRSAPERKRERSTAQPQRLGEREREFSHYSFAPALACCQRSCSAVGQKGSQGDKRALPTVPDGTPGRGGKTTGPILSLQHNKHRGSP